MRRNKLSTFHRVAALAMGLATLGMGPASTKAEASQPSNVTQSQSKKDAIQVRHAPVRPVGKKSQFHGAGDANPYKHNRTPKKNQRQLRKLWRQNPHIRSKYK
jgi:hypothetical protein